MQEHKPLGLQASRSISMVFPRTDNVPEIQLPLRFHIAIRMNALVIAGFVLTLLLLCVMLGKRNKLYADIFLIIFLLGSTVGSAYSLLEQTDWMQHSYWMLLGRGLNLLYAPLFFLYIYTLTLHRIPRWLYVVLFAPMVAYALHFFFYYVFIFKENQIEIRNGLVYVNNLASGSWLFFVILMLVIEPVYLIWFFKILNNYRNQLLSSVSNIDKIHLNWVRVLFYLRAAIVVLVVPAGVLAIGQAKISMEVFQIMIEAASLVFFFVLGYYGFNQTTVFTSQLATQEAKDTVSYERSGLSAEQSEQYHQQLLSVMKEKKPYLNGELSARELANLVGISTNHLSEVLNLVQKQNFFDFVNNFRVDEVKSRIKDPAYTHLTLLAIALDSGFNSKTSFNTVFKKFTGQTPSQYIKTSKASVESKSL